MNNKNKKHLSSTKYEVYQNYFGYIPKCSPMFVVCPKKDKSVFEPFSIICINDDFYHASNCQEWTVARELAHAWALEHI